jgi:O-methyltransferase
LKRFASVDDALRFAAECEAASRHEEAAALYRGLLEGGVSGNIDGHPMAVVFHEALVRNAVNAGHREDAVDWFERMLLLLQPAADPDFAAIYVLALDLTRSHPLPLRRFHRFFELAQLLQSTRDIAGEVAECGCFRGLSSYIIARYLRLEDPRFAGHGFHIFDSFAGLSRPGAHDEIPADDQSAQAQGLRTMTQAGAFAATLPEVQAALTEFPQIEFHAGWIPGSFAGQPERLYRFVHVDVDLYAPTLACLEYFYPRLQPGGILLSDDFSWPGARRAVEEYTGKHHVPFDANRHGQAVLHKAA